MKLLLSALAALLLLAAPARAASIVLLDDGHHVSSRGAIRPDDRFRVGSVSKTFVAVTVLQLEAEGRLALDDTADRYVAGAPAIPLRKLLNHTSGLYDHPEDPRVVAEWRRRQWRPAELLAISLEHPPVDGFRYANTNYVLLGMVVERITGRPLAAELDRRIVRPLRLTRTAYDEGPYVRGVVPGFLEGTDVTLQNTSWAGAAGAVVSSARDLATFYGSLDRLLAPAQLVAMKDSATYGLGLFPITTECGTAWGHNGAVPGYYTNAFTLDGRTAVE